MTADSDLIEGVKNMTVDDMLASNNPEHAKLSKKQKIIAWGFPGHLTQVELDIYVEFRKWVESRGGEYKNTVYSFSEVEGENYTLTRWLRARKYNLADTIKMVEEATEERAEPRKADYYPDPLKALGVDTSLFISQYPQLYTGFSKTGCPVFYSKPGVLSIDGIECLTTITGIIKFHWHVMQHDYQQRLLEFKKANPSFKRFECVSILDLEGLSVGSLNSRSLDIIKKQAFIDSLCFPETMNKMVVINAPRFFSATWPIIKGFVDVRTSNKVDLFSSKSAAEKRLKELIDISELPSDYGGTAESTTSLIAKEAAKHADMGGRSRLVTELMYIRSSQSFKFFLRPDEEAELYVHTRAASGATFRVTNSATKKDLAPPQKVIHTGRVEDIYPPSSVQLTTSRIAGGIEIKVKGESLTSRMSSDSYLLVANIYKKK